jgi:hypothetical protein
MRRHETILLATLLLPVAVTACAVTGGTGDGTPEPPRHSVAPHRRLTGRGRTGG